MDKQTLIERSTARREQVRMKEVTNMTTSTPKLDR